MHPMTIVDAPRDHPADSGERQRDSPRTSWMLASNIAQGRQNVAQSPSDPWRGWVSLRHGPSFNQASVAGFAGFAGLADFLAKYSVTAEKRATIDGSCLPRTLTWSLTLPNSSWAAASMIRLACLRVA